MQTKTEDTLGDKARACAVRAIEENAHLAELRGSHGEVVKVILDVVVRAVERGVPPGSSAAEHGHVAHDVLERGLHFPRPLGGVFPPIGWGNRVGAR